MRDDRFSPPYASVNDLLREVLQLLLPPSRDPNIVTLTKKELAAALNWSRPRLDRWLAHHPEFPVFKRGDQSSPWKFDLAAVQRFLAVKGTQPNEHIARAKRRKTTRPSTENGIFT